MGAFMALQRTQFVAQGVRRLPNEHARTASSAGARPSRSMQAHNPGKGPGS